MVNDDIAYSDRIIDLPSGFSLIWPFRNLSKSSGPYELFLDNNALITDSWFDELEIEIKSKSILSPFHALSEQWLSNPLFKKNSVERIEEFIVPFIKKGIIFENNYAKKWTELLKKNDKESRTQWMISYLYVVLLYRLVSSKKQDNKPKNLLMSLRDVDVPRFNGCIMLCTLADYIKENKSIKLVGDTKPAFSYISSFVDLHASKKNESDVDESYLRNRAGDLSMWLYLPALIQNNYQQAGDAVVVTQDKALRKLIFCCLPSVMTEGRKMAFSFDERSFEQNHSEQIWERIQANTCPPIPPRDRNEMFEKLKRLKEHVIDGAESKLKTEVNKVWEEWVVPGFFGKFTI
ncbi:hypothetical protein [Shewanella sp.]|uniref:hypothetical protein n=1 Tax=Shewanella sp. TaxID=50422 RepID=UPI003D0B6682